MGYDFSKTIYESDKIFFDVFLRRLLCHVTWTEFEDRAYGDFFFVGRIFQLQGYDVSLFSVFVDGSWDIEEFGEFDAA